MITKLQKLQQIKKTTVILFIAHENYKITFITCAIDSKFCRRQASPLRKKLQNYLQPHCNYKILGG